METAAPTAPRRYRSRVIVLSLVAVILVATVSVVIVVNQYQHSRVPGPSFGIDAFYSCAVVQRSSSQGSASIFLNSSDENGVGVEVGIQPSGSLTATSCSYYYFDEDQPVACGVMCGYGIGHIQTSGTTWKMNFSLSSTSQEGGNITITSSSADGGLPPPLYYVFRTWAPEVALNSKAATWYSNPPCSANGHVYADCLSENATSVSVELPTPIVNGSNQLEVNSTTSLVP